MKNIPQVKLGIVAVSRDCFPVELSIKRRQAVVAACQSKKINIVECVTTIENENDTLRALAELGQKGVNALVIFLGNFGPEGPTTILAQRFSGAGDGRGRCRGDQKRSDQRSRRCLLRYVEQFIQ